MLCQIYEQGKGLIDFCTECKHYENTKFLLPEFCKYYYEEKAKYLLKAFVKDFVNKLNETVHSNNYHYSADLTIF